MGTMKTEPVWLAALAMGGGSINGVDRENKILRGYIVAEKGPFKSAGRGEFDTPALQKIVELGNASPIGLKSRFTHPGLSSDGLGNYLGRAKNFQLEGDSKVRADLHFDPVAFDGPKGNLGKYVMDLADTDPKGIGSSLVLAVDKTYRLNADGTPQKSPDGKELPPLWMPKKLRASDIVDEGDATNSLLSVEELDDLPDHAVRMAFEALNQAFSGQDRETTKARAEAFIERYLNHRFGAPKDDLSNSNYPNLKMRIHQLAMALDS